MSFGSPAYLLLVVAAPVAVLLTALWIRWRGGAARRLGIAAPRLVALMLPAMLVVAAIALAALAAGRPQFGTHDRTVEARGVDLAIVLDVSNSMLADDAAPTRLGRSQIEIEALIDRLNGDHVGLIMFARQPFMRSPLTSDLRALHTLVAGIDAERSLVAPGSDLGSAIHSGQAMLARGDAQTKVMLIVSDGEDHGAGVASALADLRAAKIRVYTAGAGTAAGAPIRDLDRAGVPQPRVDASGAPVVTRLDAEALSRIANAAGGRYIALAGDGTPLTGLAAELDSLARTTFDAKRTSQPIERFQIFAALALLLAAAEMVAPLLRSPARLRRAAARLWPLGAAGLFAGAICTSAVVEVNRRGNEDYARGQYDAAVGEYRTAEAIAPGRAELSYNAGNALDRNGDFARAIDETQRVRADRNDLVARIEYALGNHYIGAARIADAVEAYKRSLLADPNDRDAKHNLEVASARLVPTSSPTRQPSATATSLTADGTPAPGGAADSGAITPNATGRAGIDGTGTPGTSGTPAPVASDELTDDELQRALDEALAGINKEFSQDEAIRALDLLDEQNRRAFERTGPPGGVAALPDY